MIKTTWHDLMKLDTKALEEAVADLQEELKERKWKEKKEDWLKVAEAIKNFTDKYDECIVVSNCDNVVYINSKDDFDTVAEIYEHC